MDLLQTFGSRLKFEFGARILGMVSSGLITVLMAHLLEPDTYGTLFLAISVFSIGMIFSRLGLANSAARYVSEYREKDRTQIRHILRSTLGINVLVIAVVAVSLFAGRDVIASLIGEPSLSTLLLVGIPYLVFASLMMFFRILLQSFEDIGSSSSLLVVDRTFRLLFVVGFVLLGYGAAGAIGGFAVGSFLATIVGLYTLYRYHYTSYERSESVEEGLLRRILAYNLPLTVTKLSGKLDGQLDTILVGVFLSPVAVSFYTIGKQVTRFIQVPSNALAFSTSPTYGSNKTTGQSEETARLFEESLTYTLLLYIPAAIGIVVVADPAVDIVFGPEYSGAVPVLRGMSVYGVLWALTNITDQPLDYLGRAKLRSIAKGATALGNVGLNVALIPTIGVMGAVYATIITHGMYVAVKLYVMNRELPIRSRKVLADGGKVGLVSVGMGAVVLYLSRHITGIVTLCLVVLAGLAIWATLSVVTGAVDHRQITSQVY